MQILRSFSLKSLKVLKLKPDSQGVPINNSVLRYIIFCAGCLSGTLEWTACCQDFEVV